MKKINYLFLLKTLIIVLLISAGFPAAHAQDKSKSLSSQVLIDATKIKAPINFCGEPVPLEQTDIKERLERELLVSLDNSDEVILWLKRANRYFPYIEKVLKNNSLPDDLKYITIAESSLRPHASSNKGAVGYWQFIEGTGKRYGMAINSDIDERRNFYKATEAALKYLQDLYGMFGSWTLAAAAYNMGEEGLKAEILVQKVNNYHQLYLNQETQRYIFRILAAKIIMSNPSKYGFVLAAEDLYQPAQFDRIEIKAEQPVPLHIIAQATNTYFKVIKDLNPHIRNYYLPAGKHELSIPRGTAMGFSGRYEQLLAQWLEEKKDSVYTVKKGENLSTISARFDVPVKAIMIWNGITNGRKIKPGDKLYIFAKEISQPTRKDPKEEETDQ